VKFIHIRKFPSSSIAGRNAEGNGTFVEAENGKVKPGTRNSKSEVRGTSLKIEIGNLKWGKRGAAEIEFRITLMRRQSRSGRPRA
jgi:hypothetical protein